MGVIVLGKSNQLLHLTIRSQVIVIVITRSSVIVIVIDYILYLNDNRRLVSRLHSVCVRARACLCVYVCGRSCLHRDQDQNKNV